MTTNESKAVKLDGSSQESDKYSSDGGHGNDLRDINDRSDDEVSAAKGPERERDPLSYARLDNASDSDYEESPRVKDAGKKAEASEQYSRASLSSRKKLK